jgi:HK97 family phage major capsid protein
MATATAEKHEELRAQAQEAYVKAAELKAKFKEEGLDPDEHPDKVTEIENLYKSAQKLEQDAEQARERHETWQNLDRALDSKSATNGRRPAIFGDSRDAGNDGSGRTKTVRQFLDESAEYQAFRKAGGGTARLEIPHASLKTLLTLTDINNPATRLPGIIRSAQEERTVADLMLQGTTDNNAISYMEETTFTNNAAEVAEGGSKPESALGFTERTENVRKIATWIPATSELLADVSGIESYIRERLVFMVRRREEQQLLVGDGTAPNISGILDRSGIQTQAKGADSVPDAIYKAMTKIRNTGFAEPTAVVMHPNDWQAIRLLTTTDGIYIWGSPATEGLDRIWGLEVRVTSAMTENTALVGAFRPDAQIFRREGITITISTEHSTYFVENKVAILAEERLALAVYRPASFCTVTGI